MAATAASPAPVALPCSTRGSRAATGAPWRAIGDEPVGAERHDDEPGPEVEQGAGAVERIGEAGRLGQLLAVRLQRVRSGAGRGEDAGAARVDDDRDARGHQPRDQRAEVVGSEPGRQAAADRDGTSRAAELLGRFGEGRRLVGGDRARPPR